MAWSRAAIEAVLARHKAQKNCYWSRPVCCDKLLDDLMALRPEPDRKALAVLFRKHSYKYASGKEWVAAIQDDLLTWARGEEAAPTWCADIQWNVKHSAWIYLDTLHSAERWHFCPICGTERPFRCYVAQLRRATTEPEGGT